MAASRPCRPASRKVLAVVHPGTKNPGYYASPLAGLGFGLEFCCPAEGDSLPDPNAYAGVMMFGGPMSANDETQWMRDEIKWVETKILDQPVPFLGACLGAQILTRAAGGQVAHHGEGRVEAGYYPLTVTKAGRDWFPRHLRVYEFHEEGMRLPEGAQMLAQGSEAFPCQAFRIGKAFAFQFHGEASLAMRRVWLARSSHRLAQPGAKPRFSHFAFWPLFEPRLMRWRRNFLKRWIG